MSIFSLWDTRNITVNGDPSSIAHPGDFNTVTSSSLWSGVGECQTVHNETVTGQYIYKQTNRGSSQYKLDILKYNSGTNTFTTMTNIDALYYGKVYKIAITYDRKHLLIATFSNSSDPDSPTGTQNETNIFSFEISGDTLIYKDKITTHVLSTNGGNNIGSNGHELLISKNDSLIFMFISPTNNTSRFVTFDRNNGTFGGYQTVKLNNLITFSSSNIYTPRFIDDKHIVFNGIAGTNDYRLWVIRHEANIIAHPENFSLVAKSPNYFSYKIALHNVDSLMNSNFHTMIEPGGGYYCKFIMLTGNAYSESTSGGVNKKYLEIKCSFGTAGTPDGLWDISHDCIPTPNWESTAASGTTNNSGVASSVLSPDDKYLITRCAYRKTVAASPNLNDHDCIIVHERIDGAWVKIDSVLSSELSTLTGSSSTFGSGITHFIILSWDSFYLSLGKKKRNICLI